MTQVVVGYEVLGSLAAKLDEFSAVLTEQEKAVLLGIFGMANTALSSASQTESARRQTEGGRFAVSGATGTAAPAAASAPAASAAVAAAPVMGSLPKLSDAFKNTFTAGTPGAFKFGGAGPLADSVDVSVGGACVSVGWSKDLKDMDPGGMAINPATMAGRVR